MLELLFWQASKLMYTKKARSEGQCMAMGASLIGHVGVNVWKAFHKKSTVCRLSTTGSRQQALSCRKQNI